jgi:hypothetical protein
MLSSLVIGAAYFTSTQQAFVSADMVYDIDFGTVFPGAVVTASFTIDTSNSEEIDQTVLPYTLSLGYSSDPASRDIRPYLLVVKSASELAEAEDGQISGEPYSCEGGLNKTSDTSDVWDVIFFVPDDIGEYDCQLIITPEYKVTAD